MRPGMTHLPHIGMRIIKSALGVLIPVIYTTVVINQKKASYFSCVVFLSIVVNHLMDENPYVFVLNRSLDTLIGIFVGLVLNFDLIYEKMQKDEQSGMSFALWGKKRRREQKV